MPLLNVCFSQLNAPLLCYRFMAEMSLSNLFQFTLIGLLLDERFDCQLMLGKTVTVKVLTAQNDYCVFHGLCSHIEIQGDESCTDIMVKCQIESSLETINEHKDCVVYRSQTVLQLFNGICSSKNLSMIDTENIKKHYMSEECFVQYQETLLFFLQRLLAARGIFYYFKFMPHQHIMKCCDNTNGLTIINKSTIKNSIEYWRHHDQYLADNWQLMQHVHGEEIIGIARKPGANDKKSQYSLHFPAQCQQIAFANDLTSRLMHSHLASSQCISTQLHGDILLPGVILRDNQCDLLVQQMHLDVYDVSVLQLSDKKAHSYCSCYLRLISVNDCYNVSSMFKRPIIIGGQKAKVVGKKNNSVDCDQIGRIKCQFSWQQEQKDDQLTCSYIWSSPRQQIAGKNWGSQFIPRVGETVWVEFLHGDPRYPIVLGVLADNKNIDCDSITARYANDEKEHKLFFTDQFGKLQMGLHSNGDVNINVDGDCYESIKGIASINVANYQQEVKDGNNKTIAEKITFKVGNSCLQLSPRGMKIVADKVIFKTEGGAGQAIACLGDQHVCPQVDSNGPHIGGKIMTTENSTVLLTGMPIASVGDQVICQQGSPNRLQQGINSLTINGHAVVTVGARTSHQGWVITGNNHCRSENF